MIARGDLAVERVYIRLAELPQPIMWMAEAADDPVVWGTEVFDKLIKTGVPSRSEVTDVTEGARSDCVMINKGDYAVATVKMLDPIFKRMQGRLDQKTPQLSVLNRANLGSTPPLDK
ncbi:pyruvate kinase [Facklamia sp. P12945]|uniref:pyruvate kinase n=1 Tax=unclassified Facklamia TaxID=2622293 RepID=UPI003D167BE3